MIPKWNTQFVYEFTVKLVIEIKESGKPGLFPIRQAL